MAAERNGTETRNIDRTFKCAHCPYITYRKSCLKVHDMVHKNLNEIPTFKCEQCLYVAKIKYRLMLHTDTHKKWDAKMQSTLPKFKCEHCSYSSHLRYAVTLHKLVHKNINEVKSF